ncbi:MAG TPA: hypothetical protein VF057_14170 [Thermoanaerobaculia bacterium]
MTPFDDFLGLAEMDLSRYRTIIFHGRSGSGKSTAIHYLRETMFPDARVIDEITTYRDLMKCRFTGERLLVATHVAPGLIRLLAPKPATVFHTDRDAAKIGRYLERLGVSVSAPTIDEYLRTFRATYTDADLIMERWPAPSFDESFAKFQKFGDIVSFGQSELRANRT